MGLRLLCKTGQLQLTRRKISRFDEHKSILFSHRWWNLVKENIIFAQ
jgi:hypothetical protein